MSAARPILRAPSKSSRARPNRLGSHKIDPAAKFRAGGTWSRPHPSLERPTPADDRTGPRSGLQLCGPAPPSGALQIRPRDTAKGGYEHHSGVIAAQIVSKHVHLVSHKATTTPGVTKTTAATTPETTIKATKATRTTNAESAERIATGAMVRYQFGIGRSATLLRRLSRGPRRCCLANTITGIGQSVSLPFDLSL